MFDRRKSRAVLGILVMTVMAIFVGAVSAHEEEVFLERSAALTAMLVEERYDALVEAFAPELAAALPSAHLKEVWLSLPTQVGPLQGVGQPRIGTDQSLPFVMIRTPFAFEFATLDLLFGFNNDGLLVTLAFVPHEPVAEDADEQPPYVDAGAFVEEELTFGYDDYVLPGVLTLPVGEGPFPVVVLVHGSGPSDRDETVGPNKPFKNIAHGLASQGIGVFRYDKRTWVHGHKMANIPLTVQEETIDDAVAALRLMMARDDVAGVFVFGHSLGGMMAPYVAAEEPGLAGVIIAAGNARPLSALIMDQTAYLMSMDDNPAAQATYEAMQYEAAIVQEGRFDGLEMIMGASVVYWEDIESRDPVGTMQEVDVPTLVLQGERDYQVTVADFELWQEGLGDRSDVTFRLYPALNHLFMAGEGPSMPTEYVVPGFVDAALIGDVADFIHGVVAAD